jgi:hypothetical protein
MWRICTRQELKPAVTAIAWQQIRNTQQWSTWEVVLSLQSVQQLRDATVGEMLGGVFLCSLC